MTSIIKTSIHRNQVQNALMQKLQAWQKSLRAIFNGMDATMNDYLKVSQKFWYRHPF